MNSRRFEVIPLRFLLPARRLCLLDLFAGTGFASTFIQDSFERTFLVEPHVGSAVVGRRESFERRVCALSPESFEHLPQANLAVCLAGFHHVLGFGLAQDTTSHRQQRLEALRLWRSQLASDGRLIVADVPAPGACAGWQNSPLDGLTDASEQGDDTLQLTDGYAVFSQAVECHDLDDYLGQMTSRCRELRLREPEPAMFFDRVVSKQSPYGHVACFDSPHELANLFCEAGFDNVRAFVAPTPWLFPTKAEALWFVHELLGIGPPCSRPVDLSVHETRLLEASILDYLGLRQLPDTSWAVSWKLMYVMGDKA